MKLHVIAPLTFFPRSQISAIHYRMFHGIGSRCGKMYPSEPMAVLNNDLREPLQVIRSKDIFPEVCKPAGTLTVTKNVADALRPLPKVEFLPVKFERLVGLFFAKGDFSFYERHRDCDASTAYFLSLPDVPEAHASARNHYEVIVAEHSAIFARYGLRRDVEFMIGPTEFDEPIQCSLSVTMCEDYPIMRLRGGTLFTDKAFEIIAPHIDWDYFITCSAEL